LEHSSEYVNAGRLQDVLALIQVLGFCPQPRRSETQLQEVFQGTPSSPGMARWSDVAVRHREFFRVAGEHKESVSLSARHAAGANEEERVLPPEIVQKLLELALDIHDRQIRHTQRWTLYVPIWIAAIAAISTLVTSLAGLRGGH
jgi:hypothetical protein